jgi:hypothetical protein
MRPKDFVPAIQSFHKTALRWMGWMAASRAAMTSESMRPKDFVPAIQSFHKTALRWMGWMAASRAAMTRESEGGDALSLDPRKVGNFAGRGANAVQELEPVLAE